MRKGSGSGTFGAPKPLPGQAGYKATETDLLQKDTENMEARLQMLQERMKQQQAEAAESTARAGGSATWGSARKDKGSVGSYAKEVQEKFKKKLDSTVSKESLLRGTASARRLLQTEEVNFKSKGVNEWTVADVSGWLADLQLKDYVSAFAQNAINGSVLLDITADDLDYMEIKALGHRKIILRGVEDLRSTGRYTSSPSNVAPHILRTASNPNIADERILQSKSLQLESGKGLGIGAETKQPAEVKTTHWSQLEPLANNKVNNPRGMSGVNAADEGDILDEAAERQAFMDAVAEWRKADAADGSRQPLRIEREYLGEKSAPKAVAPKAAAGVSASLSSGDVGGGMWKNPFAPPSEVVDDTPAQSDVLDEEAERRAFQAAVMDWRRGPVTAAPAMKPAASASTGMAARAPASPARAAASGGGAMLNGALDEEREHAEFVKAVDAWRSRDGEGSGGAAAASSSLAERLAKDLEAERVASSLRLKQQREEAERRLREANLELQKLRLARGDGKSDESKDGGDADLEGEDGDGDEDESFGAGAVYTYSSAPASHAVPSSARQRTELVASPRVTPGSGAPSPKVRTARDWSEEDYELAGKGNNVTLALVESTIGEGKEAEMDNCFVEEVDSEDEDD